MPVGPPAVARGSAFRCGAHGRMELTSGLAKRLQVAGCVPSRMAKSLDAQDWAACIIATTAPPKSRQHSTKHDGCLRSQCVHAANQWFRSSLFSRALRTSNFARLNQFSEFAFSDLDRILAKDGAYQSVAANAHRCDGIVSPSLEPVDLPTPNSASISWCSLRRHPFTIRAV
jgi:hypothetical protein